MKMSALKREWHENSVQNAYDSTAHLSTVAFTHLPRPHRESPWGDEKLSDTLTVETGQKMETLNFEISPNNSTQIVGHIKDYNIQNSYSLTYMWLLPQK